MITSTQNAKIKRICSLQEKHKERKKEQVFIVEGIKMMMEAKSSSIIEEIFVSEAFMQDDDTEILEGFKYEVVSNSVFKHISTFVTPQGILGLIKQRNITLDNLDLDDKPIIIIAENLQDPGNIGTLIRTAEAIGASGVILSEGCVDLYNPKVVRATMGSIFRVPIVHNVSLEPIVKELKRKNIAIYAAHLEGSKYYYECDFSEGVCFLIGNEGNGLSDEIAELSSEYVKIPIIGEAESLNASIAAGILMYEVVRQRTVK